MRKNYLFLMLLLISGTLSAQLYSEDFESYNTGDYMGVVNNTWWTTWSGSTGGNEDVQVGNNQASSGSNSIYFSSTSANGGPQDVVLKFGQLYNSGIFTFEADFYVDQGKSAYFNFQGSQTIGTTWALNCNMSNGVVDLDGLATGAYPQDGWFTMKIEANMTLGSWKLWVDGVLQSIWNNPVNSVASIDLYPTQGNSFYVDDISFDHATYTLPTLNTGVSGLDPVGGVIGQNVNPRVTLKNVGQNTITSFDVDLTYNGNTITENVTGISLASLQDMTVEFSNTMALVAGPLDAVAIVSNTNGMGQDGDANDDTLALPLNPILPAAGKIVVGEEATGTWCQWCPRGAVYMEIWNEKYAGYFAPVAVHNGDPMADGVYDPGVGNLIGGYPSSLVDRGPDIDPTQMGTDIDSRLQIAPNATLVNGAIWDAQTRELQISLTTTFQSTVTGDYRIACVITEDSVTGTTSGYNQSNAYAGGGSGPMGGFENLPSSVPAAQMVYDFVARGIAPEFNGMPNSFTGAMTSGKVYSHNFSFILPQDWDENKMHIVGLFIDPTGMIDNASFSDISDAVTNGFITGANIDVNYLNGPDQLFKLFPNPSHGNSFVSLNLERSSEVSISIYNVTGKVVRSRDYGNLNGAQNFPLNTSGLPQGIYQVSVRVNGQNLVKKLVLN